MVGLNPSPKEFMSALIPVTQRDVAQACGVHPSTICLALKNSPSIPVETRRRIQAVAEELGYHPNVAARNLALLRTERKPGGSLPIAWLNQEDRREHWRQEPEARACFDGAKRQAEALGFHLEEIWARQPGMTVGRLIQIIRARGIEGVLFPVHRRFDFALLSPAWGEFALVGLNDLRLGEWVEVFAPDYYHNADLALRELDRAGFRRVGLVTTARFDAATNGLAHSCFLRRQHERGPARRVAACVAPDEPARQADAIGAWLRQEQPDVVVASEPDLAEVGNLVGDAVPWVSLAPLGGGAGVEPRGSEVAAGAVEALVGKMRRFETGLRPNCRLHFLKGGWHGAVPAGEPASVVA